MLKSNWKIISRFERLTDNGVVVASFLLAYHFRDYFIQLLNSFGISAASELRILAPLNEYLVVLGFALVLYNASLSIQGAYRSMRLGSYPRIASVMLTASAVTFLSLGAMFYLLKIDLSRSFIALFCGLSAVALFVERVVVLLFLRFIRARGKNFRNLLIVGTGEQARLLAKKIESEPELGLRVVGFVTLGGAEPTAGLRVIADLQSFEGELKKNAIDDVIFTEIGRYFSEVQELALIASDEGITVSLAADFFSLEILRSEVSYFGETPLIHYQRVPGDFFQLALKRVIDLGASLVGIVLLSPLLLLITILIRMESRGPVFFRQKRVGLNGRTFTLYKFRSMVHNAEELLPSLKNRNEMEGPVFKIKDDPRVTKLGRILRKWSIDELPQLFNVLLGDMSLVGPRPPLPSEVKLYERKQRRRLSMRPGITCTWQVSGRNEIPSFEEWTKLDLEYIDNWSLGRDIRLLMRTIPAVLTGSGAR